MFSIRTMNMLYKITMCYLLNSANFQIQLMCYDGGNYFHLHVLYGIVNFWPSWLVAIMIMDA